MKDKLNELFGDTLSAEELDKLHADEKLAARRHAFARAYDKVRYRCIVSLNRLKLLAAQTGKRVDSPAKQLGKDGCGEGRCKDVVADYVSY